MEGYRKFIWLANETAQILATKISKARTAFEMIMEVLLITGIPALCWRMKGRGLKPDSFVFSGRTACGSGAGQVPAYLPCPAPLEELNRAKDSCASMGFSRDLATWPPRRIIRQATGIFRTPTLNKAHQRDEAGVAFNH